MSWQRERPWRRSFANNGAERRKTPTERRTSTLFHAANGRSRTTRHRRKTPTTELPPPARSKQHHHHRQKRPSTTCCPRIDGAATPAALFTARARITLATAAGVGPVTGISTLRILFDALNPTGLLSPLDLIETRAHRSLHTGRL